MVCEVPDVTGAIKPVPNTLNAKLLLAVALVGAIDVITGNGALAA